MEAKKQIYLAGGCFWGLEKYLASIAGVTETEVGYANGRTRNPTYEQVCSGGTGYAEAVRVGYRPDRISLYFLLELFYEAIDPLAVNRQGPDIGAQYRTGVYYADLADAPLIRRSLRDLQARLGQPVAVEEGPLEVFYPAEEYHQKYLDKHPGGYCHIGREKMARAAGALVDPNRYVPPDKKKLRMKLSGTAWAVTQENETEPPFHNEYWEQFEPGVYVDVTTGEPLFSSGDKFRSECGWPAFARPIDPSAVTSRVDESHGMRRTEVRSRVGDAHLGHVFDDGPAALGGKRYCINSSALRFIPREEMEAQGYGYLLESVKSR